jgi:tRNA(adenine34) deaminase
MNIDFMEKAIEIAKTSENDIPIGTVIVFENQIIACAANRRERGNRTIAHAEILAIDEANKKLKKWRLNECDIYVTLEPCPMCASAIIQARIQNVYFGAYDIINGAFGSNSNMKKIMKSDINIKGGILEDECTNLLKEYFKELR